MSRLVPAIALRVAVPLPGVITSLTLGPGPAIQAMDQHLDHKVELVLVLQRDAGLENPGPDDVFPVGVSVRVLRTLGLPDGGVKMLVESLHRTSIRDFGNHDVFGYACQPARFLTLPGSAQNVQALALRLRQLAPKALSAPGPERPPELDTALDMQDNPERLCDHVVTQLGLKPEESQEIVAAADLPARLERAVWFVERQIAFGEVSLRIHKEVQAAMDLNQREYFLREQLKAVQKELGEALTDEIAEYERKIAASGMPEEVAKDARRELDRLKKIHVDAAEYMVARTYLDWLVAVPWTAETEDHTSLVEARQVLDADHYGLDKVKERILEFLAVRQLRHDAKGPILCLVGPPGVGKTSLGRSVAKALGRNFERISLGGMKDEAEIRGHRRTYVGALPGRVMQALKRAGSRNPVILLDELDKIGSDFRGDPASALLEVLDPEQNHTFRDHYLDVPFDLSRVLFMATANAEDPIPAALHDRLEMISLTGYLEEEKLAIAQRHLLPKLSEQNGLPPNHLVVPEATVLEVVRSYTREAGVRGLERELAALHRKAARKLVEARADSAEETVLTVTPELLVEWQGPPKVHHELAGVIDRCGIVIGLVWTPVGGEIQFVEVTMVAGKGVVKLTGNLGETLKESAETAFSLVKAQAAALGLQNTVFTEHDFHVHLPAGGIKKDGPSAGITIVTALVGLLTNRVARATVAMTGEVSLRGRVMPIGGVKEKVLAARRAGVTELVLPKLNERDLHDIPPALRESLTFHFVDHIEEVLRIALI